MSMIGIRGNAMLNYSFLLVCLMQDHEEAQGLGAEPIQESPEVADQRVSNDGSVLVLV